MSCGERWLGLMARAIRIVICLTRATTIIIRFSFGGGGLDSPLGRTSRAREAVNQDFRIVIDENQDTNF